MSQEERISISDDVQVLAQHLGMRARISVRNRIGALVGVGYDINEGVVQHLQYCVSILSRKFSKVSRAVIEEVDYNGSVYCPETSPFHTVYVRRNGIAAWCGNSNLRMPTLEKYIRKAKAALFNVVWGVKPHGLVIPEPTGNPDVAFKLENYLDWLMEQKTKFARKLMILIDKMLEKGLGQAQSPVALGPQLRR